MLTKFSHLIEQGRELTLWDVREVLCHKNIHWPIKWNDSYGQSYYEPGEGTWACDFCGKERLPYRAHIWWPIEGRILNAISRFTRNSSS